jgi:membrane protein DedA with SNARE-associated domain
VGEPAMNLLRTSHPTSNHPAGLKTVRAGHRDHVPMVRTVSATGVLAVVVLAQVGLVLAPSQLGQHPLLVLALRPTPAFLVLVSDLVASTTAILIASVSRTLVDMAYFAVARHGALPIAQRFGVGRDLARGVSRHRATGGLLTVSFFWSSTPVVAAIGLGKTPILKFLAITGIGNITTSSVFVLSGHQFSEYIAPITSWVSAHGTQLTVVLGSTVVLSLLAALRRNTHTNPDASRV